MTVARQFLQTIFRGKPDPLHILLWTRDGKRSRWFTNVADAARCAERLAKQDLYVGVGLSDADKGPSHRCLAGEVAGIVGLWADLDLKSEAHAKVALPTTIEEALQILPPELPPTYIIETGNGAHAWWLFKEPWIFDSPEERSECAKRVQQWQSLLRANAASRGWAFDRLSDLARVLRVPGTVNCKDPDHPKPVEIYSQMGHRYNPSDFIEYLVEHGLPDPQEHERTVQGWKELVADKPLTIDPDAAIPEDLLNQYLAKDSRFRSTWSRQRHDLIDQSQSGYDMALANFGIVAGMPEQQIIDLIIHHRRIHRQQQRTTMDYFRRTITKAWSAKDSRTPKGAVVDVPATADSPIGSKPDSAHERALLCQKLSATLEIPILRIVKVSGHEPTYRVDLEDDRMILFPNVNRLIDQRSFRLKVASTVDHLVPKKPTKVWDLVAQMMLDCLTIQHGGDESSIRGAARVYLERYLHETQFIDPEEDQPYQDRYKPAVYEGRIAIYSLHLQQHINKSWNENRPLNDVTAMLSAIGALAERPKKTKLRDQSRWLLPPEFAPEAYPNANLEDTSESMS